MVPTIGRGKRVGRRGRIIFASAIALLSVASAGAAALFPQPLHLVRKFTDPISGVTSTVDEYCEGNRIVSVSGARSAVVDYEKQTVTEIDRGAATYSISTFEEIARATAAVRPAASAQAIQWNATSVAPSKWRFESAGTSVDVAVDSKVTLSREALDAIIGATYPNRRTPEHDALVRAASGDRVQAESSQHPATYALPVEETVTRERLTTRNVVVRITNDAAPAEAVMIPPGAKRVESRRMSLPRLINELDRLP